MTNQKPLCIYHGNCADGFTAAWVVKQVMPDTEFFAGVYGNDGPDVTGRHVLMVDFSYKSDVLRHMAKVAKSVTILDHHESARDDIQPLIDEGIVKGVFDMERSGAMITWEYFYSSEAPDFIKYVQDRDLWLFALDHSRDVSMAVFSNEYTFDGWDKLVKAPINELVADGAAIQRKHMKDVKELIEVTKTRMTIAGHDVPVANLPYTMASDAGHIMSQGELFAATYYITSKGRHFSLRSTEDGMNVADIAKQYGGGGHAHSAGFLLLDGASL